jgi:cysteine/O-acetylserine efflux protein
MNIDLVPFLTFIIITTFTPGPNNIYSASMGVVYGYRKSENFLFGIASGFAVIMLICAFLATRLLSILPTAEIYLRWFGAAYILWLAVGNLKSGYTFSESEKPVGAYSEGLFLQLVNPKVAVYGLTIYSTFLASLSGQTAYLLLSAVIFALVALISTSTWTLFGAVIKERLKNDSFRKAVNSCLSLLLLYTALELSGIL